LIEDIAMSVAAWDELTKSEQRLMIRLFGGGSVRNQATGDIEGLRQRGLINGEQKLSLPGLLVFTLALQDQQTIARQRAAQRLLR
jgi:hypothetical protein